MPQLTTPHVVWCCTLERCVPAMVHAHHVAVQQPGRPRPEPYARSTPIAKHMHSHLVLPVTIFDCSRYHKLLGKVQLHYCSYRYKSWPASEQLLGRAHS